MIVAMPIFVLAAACAGESLTDCPIGGCGVRDAADVSLVQLKRPDVPRRGQEREEGPADAHDDDDGDGRPTAHLAQIEGTRSRRQEGSAKKTDPDPKQTVDKDMKSKITERVELEVENLAKEYTGDMVDVMDSNINHEITENLPKVTKEVLEGKTEIAKILKDTVEQLVTARMADVVRAEVNEVAKKMLHDETLKLTDKIKGMVPPMEKEVVEEVMTAGSAIQSDMHEKAEEKIDKDDTKIIADELRKKVKAEIKGKLETLAKKQAKQVEAELLKKNINELVQKTVQAAQIKGASKAAVHEEVSTQVPTPPPTTPPP